MHAFEAAARSLCWEFVQTPVSYEEFLSLLFFFVFVFVVVVVVVVVVIVAVVAFLLMS